MTLLGTASMMRRRHDGTETGHGAGEGVDREVERSISARVAERLAEARIDGSGRSRIATGSADERELVRSLVGDELDGLVASQLAAGDAPMTPEAESRLAEAVLASVVGLGRITGLRALLVEGKRLVEKPLQAS